jgi:hypothetical protein
MVAIIQKYAPDLFSTPGKDETYFKCSEAYVRNFLLNTMGWSAHRATKAAQKLPENYEEILTNTSFFRKPQLSATMESLMRSVSTPTRSDPTCIPARYRANVEQGRSKAGFDNWPGGEASIYRNPVHLSH